jgi:FkbM family methyltransferase
MTPRWMQAAAHLGRLPELARCAVRLRPPVRAARAYLGLGARYPFELATRRGTRFRVDGFHDLATAWVIFCRGEYAVDPRARCIVDIGANFGAFTLLAAEAAPEARIVAVEPFPAEFARLQANVAANGLAGRVRCLRVAVAAEAGERRMETGGAPAQSRGLLPPDAAPEASVAVFAEPLGDILRRAMEDAESARIDLVKMDVEGAEHELIPHLTAETLARVDAWQMEYHPNGPSAPLFAALERAGLRLVRDLRFHPDSGVAWFRRQDT